MITVMVLNAIMNKASDDDEAEKFDYRILCINRHDLEQVYIIIINAFSINNMSYGNGY